MKKTPISKHPDEMQSEYKFDYGKAKPNRFAARINKDKLVIVLDSDVSKVFKSSESVNAVLRALIATMPKTTKQKMAVKNEG